ncbi:hypothetical protein HQ590_07060 [bacterium]|nr:hypothetical protein [bacterium]
MTSRQRFAATVAGGQPDHVPWLEEGLRDEVIDQWREQGLAPDADLAQLFAYDRRDEAPVNLEPRPALERPPGSRRDLADLRQRLDPDDPARLPADWPARVDTWRGRDHLLQLAVHRGFFLSLGVRNWAGFEAALYLMHDRPALVEAIMAVYAEFHARLAARVLREIEIDFAVFSEPIGGNAGPLMSTAAYRRFALRHYQPVLDVLRQHGVRTIVFVTYSNARALIPAVLEAGFDYLWACETESAAMDYRALRREFGPSLRLIGGIDLDVLLQDRAAIRRELETKVPPLLAQGGYIPLADGRVRANMPLASYRYYRQLLQRLTLPTGTGPALNGQP